MSADQNVNDCFYVFDDIVPVLVCDGGSLLQENAGSLAIDRDMQESDVDTCVNVKSEGRVGFYNCSPYTVDGFTGQGVVCNMAVADYDDIPFAQDVMTEAVYSCNSQACFISFAL